MNIIKTNIIQIIAGNIHQILEIHLLNRLIMIQTDIIIL